MVFGSSRICPGSLDLSWVRVGWLCSQQGNVCCFGFPIVCGPCYLAYVHADSQFLSRGLKYRDFVLLGMLFMLLQQLVVFYI